MGLPLRTRRPPGHDPTFSTPRNQVRQVDETRSDCNRNIPASPSHGRTRCNAAPRHLRRREPGACHSTRYRVHIPQKALTRFRLRSGSQPAPAFFRHRADMVPPIHVVVDILVSITYVLVDIYYFYCPLSRISTTQGRHRSGAARAEAPLRQAATPRNWLRGRCVEQPVLSNKEIPLSVPEDRPGQAPRTGQGRRRTVPHARSASGKPVSPKKCSMKEKTITQPAVCRACTTTRQIVRS